MNNQFLKILSFLVVLLLVTPALHAADDVDGGPAASAASAVPDSDESPDWAGAPVEEPRHRHRRHHEDGDVFHLFGDSHLDEGAKGGDVVSVFGNSYSDGEAGDVVSVFGNVHATHSVGGDAVAVFGNLYIDGTVHGDATAVFGDVELGPNAVVDGAVNAVLGAVHRDSQAAIHGGQHSFGYGLFGHFQWLRAWVDECLLKGRPLAFAPGLGWAWTLALGALGVYLLIAVLFPAGVRRCIETLEHDPGHTTLAAFLTVLLTPVLLVLLCVTVIGMAAVPFVFMALLCVSLFGKAVILAWLGGRIAGGRPLVPALAVLIGGLIALGLYLVPFLGLLVYKLLGFFGTGAVVYTLIQKQRARQEARADQFHPAPPPASTPGANGFQAPPADTAFGASAAAAGVAGAAAAGAAGFSQASAPPPGATPPHAVPHGPPPAEIATYPRAGFWVRMVALLIDAALIGFLLSFMKGVGPFHWHAAHHLHLVVLAVYGAIMWKMRGSTIGGLALDLRVVRLDGRPVEWESAIVRALGCFLSLFFLGLGFIWIAIDPQRQGWHDKIAGTVVVRVPKGTPFP